MYEALLRPLLFRLDAERAHGLALAAGARLGAHRGGRAWLRARYGVEDARLRTHIGGFDLPNPIGLPAGLDKNGVAVPALAALGFGMIDIGSVSALPSAGNPERPRLHRLPADRGIVVNYGVPNDGAAAVAARLAGCDRPVPLGVSLVETNTGRPVPTDAVIAEFVAAARAVRAHCDYRILNLFCPNSPAGIAHFDDPARLRALLQALADTEAGACVFLRLAPPADDARIDALLGVVDAFPFVRGIGFYVRPPDLEQRLATPAAARAHLRGSFSGPASRDATLATLRQWYPRIDRARLALIGVGGVFSAADAYACIRAGATLVQVLTALVYRGPGVVGEIKRGLAALLARDGFASAAAAVGADHA
ncbi:MAG: dihydroorotate dehydrogenase (quinone) [Burkholderiales bacterium]|nr:dihydroorotate dehydrogenase (quinone) [Burkholderiales bacterium]